MITPRHPISAKSEPVFSFPTVSLETNHLSNKIPFPDRNSVGTQAMHPRPKRRKIHPVVTSHRCRKNRLTTVDASNQFPIPAIKHVIESGHRSNVNKPIGHARGSNIVAVATATLGLKLPTFLTRPDFNARQQSRTVHHINGIAGYDGGCQNCIGHWHGNQQAERFRHRESRCVARSQTTAQQLRPLPGTALHTGQQQQKA